MSCPQRIFIKFSSNQVGGQDKEFLVASAACQLVLRRPFSERHDFVHCESLFCGGAEHYHVLVDCDFRNIRPATNKEVSIRCFRVDSSHGSHSESPGGDLSLEEIHVQRTLIDEIPWGWHPASSAGKPSSALHPAASSSSSSSTTTTTTAPARQTSRSRSRLRSSSSSSSTTPSAEHSPARAAASSTPFSSPPSSPSTSPLTSSPGVFQPRRLKSPLSTTSGTSSPLSLQPSANDSIYSKPTFSSSSVDCTSRYIPFVDDSMPQARYFAPSTPTTPLGGTGQGQAQGQRAMQGRGREWNGANGHKRDLSGHFGECISSLTLSP